MDPEDPIMDIVAIDESLADPSMDLDQELMNNSPANYTPPSANDPVKKLQEPEQPSFPANIPILSTYSGEKTPIVDFNTIAKTLAKKKDTDSFPVIQQREPLAARVKGAMNPIIIPPEEPDQLDQMNSFQDGNAASKRLPPANNQIVGKPMVPFPSGCPLDSTDTIQEEQDQPSSFIFDKVQQIPWENLIIYDQQAPSASSSSTNTAVTAPPTRKPLWDMDWEVVERLVPLKSTHDFENNLKECMVNYDLLNGDWIQAIQWDESSLTCFTRANRLIFDLNDKSLLFSDPKMDDVRPTLRIPRRKLGAAEEKRALLEKQKLEKHKRLAAAQRNIDYGEGTAEGGLVSDGKKAESKSRMNLGHAHHSVPAVKLVLTKPELPKSKLRDFHRPIGKFKINEHFAFDKVPQETEGVQIRRASDLSIAAGKFILIEFTEERPPVVMNSGMASRLLHYWRPPARTDKKAPAPRPEPPKMDTGRVITLNENDDTPFVGDVPAGKMVTSLDSKLYKAPLFQHNVRAHQRLFIISRIMSKSSSKRNSSSFSGKSIFQIAEVPSAYTVGQIEPQMIVPAPNSRSANEFIRPYMSLHILRLFKKTSDGERLKIEDIARAFPNQSGTAIRKRMKEVATFERGGNDSGWWKKKAQSQLKSEDEIRTNITPDAVCLYESMMSGHRRLYDVGLTKISTPSGVGLVINQMIKRFEKRKQQLSKLVDPAIQGRQKAKAIEDIRARDDLLRTMERDIQIARYIHEQLQITPWNLSNNYVECHLQGKGSGMLKLGGIGDPTGRGEGFSFVKVPQSRAKKKESDDNTANAENDVQNAVAAVTGTTADLRKLKMKEAGDVLRNLGMADADIKKLKRWDRIHMVRELSSRATARGFAASLAKFARGARKSLSSQQQAYRKKCDVIYARQIEVLSSSQTKFSSDEEDESEDDVDLEEMEKDLEDDILGAEDSKRIGHRGPSGLFKSGGGGFNRSREALAERDDAAELQRLMREMKDDSDDKKPEANFSASAANRRPDVDSGKLAQQLQDSGIFGANQASASGSSSVAPAQGLSAVNSIPESVEISPQGSARTSRPSSPKGKPPLHGAVKAPKRLALKRTIRLVQEDGTETTRVEFLTDERQIRIYKSEQQRKEYLRRQAQPLVKKRRKPQEEDIESLSPRRKKKRLQEELRQLQRTEEQNKGYQSMLLKQGDAFLHEKVKGTVKCTKCGQVGHNRTNRDCPLYSTPSSAAASPAPSIMQEDALNDPLKLKIRTGAIDEVQKCTVNISALQKGVQHHQEEQKKRKMLEAKEQAELYKRPHGVTKPRKRKYRIPIAHLNAELEKIYYALIKMASSIYFIDPVDAVKVPDYYEIVKEPMALKQIRDKLEHFAYASASMFMKDIELIYTNARLYNGDPTRSSITKGAFEMLEKAKDMLMELEMDGTINHLQKLSHRTGNAPVSLAKRQSATTSSRA